MHTKCNNIDLFLLTIFTYGSAKKPDEGKKTVKRTTKLKLYMLVQLIAVRKQNVS